MMKTNLKRWVGRVPDISDVIARFPVPVVLMGIFTLLLIIDLFSGNEPLSRMMAGLIIGAYLAFCVTIAREAKGRSRLIPMQVLLAVIAAVLAWFSQELHINLPMAVGASLLILGNMVIWKKSRDDLHVWDFTHKIWTGAVFATVGSIIFMLGVFAITAALKSLFGLNINQLIERLIMPIGLGFLAPLYWLSTAPKTDESYQELHGDPGFVSKAVAFMGTWLLSPLTLIYALILIAYGLKIIMAGSLPKGEIAQLTTPFLIIGGLTWLILEPPFIRKKNLAKLFRKVWFPLSIPAAILLALAVGVRIHEYGFTPERIALALAVIWALAVGFWFAVGPKVKRDIRLVPGIAAVLLYVGALAADGVSLQSQKSRAIEGMKGAGIMTEAGRVKPLADIIITDEAAALRAKGGLSYLARQNEQKTLDDIFLGADDIPEAKRYGNNKLFQRLALNEISLPGRASHTTRLVYDAPTDLDIKGYEYLLEGKRTYLIKNNKLKLGLEARSVKVTFTAFTVKITAGDGENYTIDMTDYIDGLKASDKTSIAESAVIELNDSAGKKLTFVIQQLNTSHDKNDQLISANLEYVLLMQGY